MVEVSGDVNIFCGKNAFIYVKAGRKYVKQ